MVPTSRIGSKEEMISPRPWISVNTYRLRLIHDSAHACFSVHNTIIKSASGHQVGSDFRCCSCSSWIRHRLSVLPKKAMDQPPNLQLRCASPQETVPSSSYSTSRQARIIRGESAAGRGGWVHLPRRWGEAKETSPDDDSTVDGKRQLRGGHGRDGVGRNHLHGRRRLLALRWVRTVTVDRSGRSYPSCLLPCWYVPSDASAGSWDSEHTRDNVA